jgi:ADP-ribose pyrophosphatase YjhB (NUDIX family)
VGRAELHQAAHVALLRLWRVAPLPGWARGAILWCANQRFLIGVVGLIYDEQGRVLLGRHTYLPPPAWSLPGGWLRAGEGLAAGVRREVAEEIGLAVEVGPLVAWTEIATPLHYTFGFVCYARGGTFRPSAEIVEIAYFPVAEAARVVPPELRPLVEMAARRAEPQG